MIVAMIALIRMLTLITRLELFMFIMIGLTVVAFVGIMALITWWVFTLVVFFLLVIIEFWFWVCFLVMTVITVIRPRTSLA